MVHPIDPKTRLAAKTAYLRTAQDALVRATGLEDDDARRGALTEITSSVAREQHAAVLAYAEVGRSEADRPLEARP